MSLKVYIGTDLCDINTENISSTFSVGDFKDLALGNLNKSFTIKLPMTKKNKAIVKKFLLTSETDEITDQGRIFVNDLLLLGGKVLVLNYDSFELDISISADDWADRFTNSKLQDLDLSAYEFNTANVEASWTAANAFYRYPMIYYGEQFVPLSGLVAEDFLPMFRLYDILTTMFAPYTISSTFLNSAYFKSLYILGKELQAPSAFLQKKGLSLIQSVPETKDVIVPAEDSNGDYIEHAAWVWQESLDEASAWASNAYTVPETGSYRFSIALYTSLVKLTGGTSIVWDQTQVRIQVVSSINGVMAEYFDDCSTGEHLASITHSLDSWHLWLVKDEVITIYLWIEAIAHNTDTSDHSFRFGYADAGTTLDLMWSNKNLVFGEGGMVFPSLWMPDIKQIDFIKAIKEIFNLRFFVDRNKHVIYTEPVDTFFTDNVVDLTSYQIFDPEPEIAELSPEYTKYINLKWIEDTDDLAIKDYRLQNTNIYDKNITLLSEYAKAGFTDMISSLFAYTPLMIPYFFIGNAIGWTLPTIWGAKVSIIPSSLPEYSCPRVRNPSNWKSRIFKWEGMTANPGVNWQYGAVTKTTYPKVSQLDWDDIYNSYWQKTIHWIDKGKLATIYIRLPQSLLNQLMTVVNDSATEGFRAKYKFTIKGETAYGILNNIETDGIKAKCEFLIRK